MHDSCSVTRGRCVDPCKDLFLRPCFVRTELLKTQKTLRPRKGTSVALLPPALSLPCLRECAPCPPMATKHFENPCLSLSCASDIHLRRGLAVNLNLICHRVIILTRPSYLALKTHCNVLHFALLTRCCLFPGSGDDHKKPLVLFVICLAVLFLICAISPGSMENHSENTIV